MANKGPNIKSRVKHAVEGAREGGLAVTKIEIERDGKVVIFAGKSGERTDAQDNEWDRDKTLWPVSS